MLRSLLGHLLDFLYWAAVLGGLILLGPNIESTPLLIAALTLYAAAAIALYFVALRRIKRYL
ncbi:MAG: hypothetical protein JNK87_05615 [Bryobacterales bacterium]|nr:hypothetical protein [Bryobacterales bacterium]